MKVKMDFITNSSSTSYVIHIPHRFEINDLTEHIEELLLKNDFDDEEDPEKINEGLTEVEGIIKVLKSGNSINNYDTSSPIFNTVLSLMEEYKFIMRSINGQGGADELYGVSEKELIKILNQK